MSGGFTPDESAEMASVMQDDNVGKPVRIRWVDSGLAVGLGWKELDDMPSDVETVETVGLWMGENERVVMVGGSRDSTNRTWLGTQLIYKPCITTREWL